MKKFASIALPLVIAALAFFLWTRSHPARQTQPTVQDSQFAQKTIPPARPASAQTPAPASPRANPSAYAPAMAPMAADLPVPASPEGQPVGLSPDIVLQNMRRTIIQYGSMFGGNPVGTNPEITRALAGENPKHINFLKADGNRVNSRGELIDPWGTPYFFHQLSGTEMEIRSAGPDRQMYTSDDLVVR